MAHKQGTYLHGDQSKNQSKVTEKTVCSTAKIGAGDLHAETFRPFIKFNGHPKKSRG